MSTTETVRADAGLPRRRRGRGLSRRTLRWLQTIVLLVVALAWVYPLLWIFSASVKDALGIFSSGLSLWPESWHWENYARAWDEAGFSQYMLNSIVVTVATVVIVVVRCATAGYVIARYRFVGRRVLVGVLAATMFVPTGLFVVPVVELSDMLGLLNTHLGLILALSGGGHVAAVLLYAGFYSKVPKELEEAATVDGAGFLRTFFAIMLPLSGPITATVVVLTFLATWNNFFLPLVFTFSVPQNRTLAVGMLAFEGTNTTDWSGLAAAASLSLLPILLLFLVLQRYFVEGIAGAVKS